MIHLRKAKKRLPLKPTTHIAIMKSYNGIALSEGEGNALEAFLERVQRDESLSLHCCIPLVIRQGKNRRHVARAPSQHHNEQCPLNNRPQPIKRRRNRERPSDIIVDVMSGTSSVSPGETEGSGPRKTRGESKTKRISRLLALLLQVLDSAQLHKLDCTKRSLPTTIANIKTAAQQYRLPADITLDSMLHFNELNLPRLKEALRRPPKDWPATSTWHQIVLYSCDKFERKDDKFLLYNGNRKPVTIFNYGRAKLSNAGFLTDKSEGPFLFILVFQLGYKATDPNASFVQLAKCAVTYINNKSEWCPLESQYESAMHWALRKVMPDLAPVRLEKPLFDDCDVRPDFVLVRDQQASVAIEVAGMDTPEYRESKAKTHPVMQQLFTHLFEWQAANVAQPYSEAIKWLKQQHLHQLLAR
ncbi:hypothetical protein IC617_08695 [Neiella sp. HB171785]|uniref:Uncharacterized protein n=1 Tax=Neiella litorisoli TaxID=2771431 RepID=A0A8J6UEI7_9GAMM|nr:hypothetical protein [Neiella litorisoli]MBD1389504.1 hypothetical protein [Neiella litorisoli]